MIIILTKQNNVWIIPTEGKERGAAHWVKPEIRAVPKGDLSVRGAPENADFSVPSQEELG